MYSPGLPFHSFSLLGLLEEPNNLACLGLHQQSWPRLTGDDDLSNDVLCVWRRIPSASNPGCSTPFPPSFPSGFPDPAQNRGQIDWVLSRYFIRFCKRCSHRKGWIILLAHNNSSSSKTRHRIIPSLQLFQPGRVVLFSFFVHGESTFCFSIDVR